MLNLYLPRVCQSPKGTFGSLIYNKVPFAVTLERPWLDNKTGVSCIPAGSYLCRRVQSPKFGNTFTVCNVPGRFDVRFHWGNEVTDTEGCIIVAEEFAGTIDHPIVASSKIAFDRFIKLLDGVDEFELYVFDPIADLRTA